MRAVSLMALLCASCVYNHPFEVCNGVDDDDDPTTVDGLEDPKLGEPCDGDDRDLCPEGSIVCSGGALACNDATTDNHEVCNTEDDDCNGIVDDSFDLTTDALNCGACELTCTNANGSTECSAGMCAPTCASGAVDCNGDVEDGCEVYRDRNPTCMQAKNLGAINGDVPGGMVELTGTDEAIVAVTLKEISTSGTAVTAMIELDVPPGLDYDLHVRCEDCEGAIMGSSRNPAGMAERVPFRHRDTSNVSDDSTIYIEVRFVSETTCHATWKLRVVGGAAVSTTTCGPV